MTISISINPNIIGKPGNPAPWRKINNGFYPVDLETPEIIERIQWGYAYTTVHRRVSPGLSPSGKPKTFRCADNFVSGQHVCLDFDSEDERSDPRTLLRRDFITSSASFIHTTASHRPEAPRCRVFFQLSEPIADAGKYSGIVAGLISYFNMVPDRHCTDPVRIFYGAVDCEVHEVGKTLDISVANALAKAAGREAKKRRRTGRGMATNVSTELTLVRDALRYIPVPGEGNYDQWLRVLMALHTVAPGVIGEQIAEEWAPGYDGEIGYKFTTFSPEGNAHGAVGVGTIYHLATQNGWDRREAMVRAGVGSVWG
jgi:hypothetical protein